MLLQLPGPVIKLVLSICECITMRYDGELA